MLDFQIGQEFPAFRVRVLTLGSITAGLSDLYVQMEHTTSS